MKTIKKYILFVMIIIVLIFCILIFMMLKQKKQENNDIINMLKQEQQEENEDNVEVDSKIRKVRNVNNYYSVKYIAMSYVNGLLNKDKDIIYVLNSDYVKNNNITIDNLYSKINSFDNEGDDKSLEITNMLVSEQSSNISVFFVYGNIKDTITKEKIPTNFVVIVDFENETYNILPSEYMDSIEIQEESNFELNIKQIEANQYNSFEYEDVDKNTIILDHMDKLINELVYNVDNSYSTLYEKNYRETRFGSLEEYKKYVSSNLKYIMSSEIEKYQVNEYKDYTQYVLKDQNDNYYIFEDNGVMNFTVKFDNYTIPTEKFTTTYKDATDEQKIQMNVNKFVQMINRQDYRMSYALIDDGFKNNYFKTNEDFEKFIKDKFFLYNSISFKSIEAKGNNTYVVNVEISDITKESSENKDMTIIMQLKDDIDFVMAFGMDE